MLNRICIQGRFTADPELKTTQSGVSVLSFTIACNRDKDTTDFFDVVAWRGTAEFINRYFTKGSLILVDGRLQNRKWEDKNGNKRTSIEIHADRVDFCGSANTQTEAINNTETEDFEEVDADEDLPF